MDFHVLGHNTDQYGRGELGINPITILWSHPPISKLSSVCYYCLFLGRWLNGVCTNKGKDQNDGQTRIGRRFNATNCLSDCKEMKGMAFNWNMTFGWSPAKRKCISDLEFGNYTLLTKLIPGDNCHGWSPTIPGRVNVQPKDGYPFCPCPDPFDTIWPGFPMFCSIWNSLVLLCMH